MSALDDDPYLAELLDLTNEELGDGNEEAKKGGATGATAASASQASASSAAAAAASSSSSAAAAAASSSQPSPAKAPSYRSSDTHRETLKLLSQLSPSMAKPPSESEVRGAFQELFGAGNDDDEDFDATEEEKVQRALEEHLDVADLAPRLNVIREEMRRLKQEREQRRLRQSQSQGLSLSQSLSQQSLVDELSQSQATGQGKKRRRVVVPGGKSELPLTLPKGVATAAEGSGKSKGPKSLLVELDERDKGQDLTGDSGAVGRVHVSKKRGMVLDLKGHQYLASMTRCPALLLVSVGEEEAKVEDVVENLCVLTHLRDHLQAMGGQLVKKGAGHDDEDGGEDEEDYSRFNYGDSDADGNGKPAAKKKAGAAAKTSSARGGGGGKKGGGAGGKGKGKGKGGGGSGGRKSAAAGAKKKAVGPKKVSLKALKAKKKKGADSDEEESESYSEPDNYSDSDF